MQTHLAPEYAHTEDGRAAEAILRSCVHCGFCTATCPTYQLLGDELDGPRGRIYLIKEVLEGAKPTRATQTHLDRCLTCRNCETTCPSGVQYGRLIDIGRRVVDAHVERPAPERMTRALLREGMTSPLFAPAMKLGQLVRSALPATLQNKVPARGDAKARARAQAWPVQNHARKVLMLQGCVQPAMAPNINSAAARVLDALSVQTLVADGAGCCGAVREHLVDHAGALADIKRNVDAWWPWVEGGTVEAIVMTASGCGVMVKDYGHALASDPLYAERARRIAAITVDLTEYLLSDVHATALDARLASLSATTARATVAYHPPCTLQHGQKLRGGAETLLKKLGFDVRVASGESHLCCGSAGTYSVLQPALATQLRDRKLARLEPLKPGVIASANVGCIQHLQSGTNTRVAHWIELVDEVLVTMS